MGEHKLAIILGIVTVVYLIAMILLFWQYRRAMDQLSDKMRECEEKAAQAQQAEKQAAEAENAAEIIYHRPDVLPEAAASETAENEKTQSAS